MADAKANPDISELRGARVLITGGLGFIGSNLARRCLDLGAEVTIYDCLDPRSGGNMYNVSEFKDRCSIVLNDIRNFEGVSPVVRENDFLFSCAAYTSHPSSMKDPITDIDVNCKGIINLLEAARRFNPNIKIVHVGTSTQIGRMAHNPIDEGHPEFPVDIYSANKTASEKYVLVYANAYGIPGSVVRLANTYGPRSNIRSPEFGFVNYFIGLALQGKEIPIFGKGEQFRTLTYVDDCVEALVLAACKAEAAGQVFFGVSDQKHTVRELAQAIVDGMKNGSIRNVEWPRDREAIEVGDALISNQKIRKVLGWRPEVPLAEGLERTRAYFSTCLPHYVG